MIRKMSCWLVASIFVINAGIAAVSPAKQLLPLPNLSLSIENWQTKQGAHVYYVQRAEQPIVDVQVIFPAGSAYDADHPGLANLTSSLFAEGAEGLTAQQIAQQMAALGAQFDKSLDRDKVILSLRTLSEQTTLKQAVTLYNRIINQPDFNQAALKRTRAQIVRSIQYQQGSPADVAKKHFFENLYGQQAYAHSLLGNLGSVKAIHKQDIKTFYQQHYVAKNAVITIVGDVNKASAEHIADFISRYLPKGKSQARIVRSSSRPAFKKHVDFDAEQVHIYMGMLGVNRQDPDYLNLLVANEVLGVGMESRLFKRVRKQQGLAYSAHSRLLPWLARGPFMINLQTRKQKAKQAIELVEQIVSEFVKQGPSAREVMLAKNSIIQSLPFKLANNASINGWLATIGFYQLPLNYYQQLPKRLSEITPKQVKLAVQAHFGKTHFSLLTVGRYG